MQVHEQPRHRIQEPVAVRPWAQGEPHQEAPVLDREVEVLGDQDGRLAFWRLGEPDRRHGGEAQGHEMAQDLELGPRDIERLFLERVGPADR